MKLRTSYFNPTVLKKDVTRFFPVWALYGVVLFLCITNFSTSGTAWMGQDLVDFMQLSVWINLFYAGICGSLLFGDLFSSRMCNALHAMPLRREGWLLTHFVSGLLFSAIPNLVATAIMAVMLQQYYYLALIWLGAAMLQFLFFFGLAIFSVMCSGNRLGMAAVYLIINWLGVITYAMAQQFYEPLLYGIRLDSAIFQFFSPSFHLVQEDLVEFSVQEAELAVFGGFCMEAWYYLFALAAIGLALLILATLLYRRRKLECAGDFLALRVLRPVFLVIYTLGMGVVLSNFTDLFGTGHSYAMLCVGIVVGFFTGMMLLERTVRVFRWKNILGFVALAVVFVASLVLTWLDPAGITTYIPETEEIQWMRVYDSSDNHLYENPNLDCYQLTEPAELEQFRQIHQQLLSDEDGKAFALGRHPAEWSDVRILYKLKDGSTVIRYYYMQPDTPAGDALKSYFSSWQYLFCTDNWQDVLNEADFVEVTLEISEEASYETRHYTIKEPVQVLQFLEAVRMDCDAGKMVQDWIYHRDKNSTGWITIYMDLWAESGHPGLSTYVSFFPECHNILAFLETQPSE